MNREFQILQGHLAIYLDEDTVANIALGVSNSNLSDEDKIEVLKNIIKPFLKKERNEEIWNARKKPYDKIVDTLNELDVDGEMMQYIIERVGMNDQMLRQLILSNPQSDTKDLLDEHIELSDKGIEGVNFPPIYK